MENVTNDFVHQIALRVHELNKAYLQKPQKLLFNSKEAGELLGYPATWIETQSREDPNFPCVRYKGYVMYDVHKVKEYLEQHSEKYTKKPKKSS